MNMNDVPRRFIIRAGHPLLKELGLEEDKFGLFFPDFGEHMILSSERGYDDFTGCPEDIEWIDP